MKKQPKTAEEYLAKVMPPAYVDFSGVSVLSIGWDKFHSPDEVYRCLPKGTLMETRGGGIWCRTRYGVRDFVTNRFITLKKFAEQYPTVRITFYDAPPSPRIYEMMKASTEAIHQEYAEKTTAAAEQVRS